ncbi:MAG: alkaline phosphatase family protein [Candidatus Thorarchaeota archaeon]
MESPNIRPDYKHSIVNLTSALAGKMGIDSICKGLEESSLYDIEESSTILFIIIDGLGYNYLLRHGSGLWLRDHLVSSMSSVFPPSTGSAMTSFYTATTPLQHGITGWFVYLKDLGVVSRFLPFSTLVNEKPMQTDVAPFVGAEPWLGKIQKRSIFLGPQRIINSSYSRFVSSGCTRIGYHSLQELFGNARDLAIHAHENQFMFVYWPELDATGHDEGIESEAAINHLTTLDKNLEKLAKEVPNNVRIIITSDHGIVDVEQENTVKLANHPELKKTLIAPVCGDTRTCYFYVRPNKVDAFQSYMNDHLAHACTMYQTSQLVDMGWFGPGEPSNKFDTRAGDFVALMKEGYALLNDFPGEEYPELVGQHGGLSEDEMLVPLVIH